MFYIFWALLSLAVIIYFIYMMVLGGKMIREKLGVFAMIIFVVAILGFVARPNNNNQQTNTIKQWAFTPVDSLEGNQKQINNVLLESTPISKNTMGFTYATDIRTHKNRPVCAFAFTSGVIIGTNWKPLAIQLDTTSNNQKFRYSISGATEWKLLGVTVFSQANTYSGVANLK